MKSQQRVAPLWKWSSDRPIKVTFPHVASTPREIGRVGTIISLSSTSRRIELVTPNLIERDRWRPTYGSRHLSTRMPANEKLAPQRAYPVDDRFYSCARA